MKYKYFMMVTALTLSSTFSLAQESDNENKPNKVNINFLLRSSLELSSGSTPTSVKLNEARVEVLGTILPGLEYRIRYRLNRSHATTSQDNAAAAIDHAAVNYKFGEGKKWSLNVGKQSASVGSWEFEHNPTYEYQYSEFVNNQTNIFLTAIRLGYQLDKNHSFYLQLHNTYNENFNAIHSRTGYNVNGLKSSKTPVGMYASWQGNFLDNKLRTFWSYNLSKYANGNLNYAVALGQKVQLKKFHGYLDLQSANLDMDYVNIASPALNNYFAHINPGTAKVFARNINYKSAILRLDYQFARKWFITTKAFYETSSNFKNDREIGKNFRQNIGYLAGIEFKPVATENFKLFGYYYHNTVNFRNALAEVNNNEHSDLFAFGVLYFINAL